MSETRSSWMAAAAKMDIIKSRIRGDRRSVSSLSNTKELPGRSTNQSPPDTEVLAPELRYGTLNTDQNEIRLLIILPGEESSTIRSVITPVSLDSQHQFTAVSYCWGDPKHTRKIIVNNCEVQATVNLEAALKELRRRGVTTLWVDALCINQNDNTERGHQVSHMGKIYSQSSHTFCWLGNDDYGVASSLFSFMELLASKNPLAKFREAMDSIRLWETDLTYYNKDDGSPRHRWSTFALLCSNPYWKRTWIIQEIALSLDCTIAWGRHSLGRETLLQSLRHVFFGRSVGELNFRAENRIALDPSFDCMFSIVRIMGQRETKQQPVNNFMDTLWYTCGSQAKDPRDKFFGIIALCYDASTIVESPVYGTPLNDVIIDIAAKLVSGSTNPLELICLKNPFKESTNGLPTWVPDWQEAWENWSQGSDLWISLIDRLLEGCYEATGGTTTRPLVVNKQRILRIEGLEFDRISECIGLFNHLDPDHGDSKIFSAEGYPKSIYGPTGTVNAIWRTLVMDLGLRNTTKADRAPPEFAVEFPNLWSERGISTFESLNWHTTHKSFRELQYKAVFGKTFKEWSKTDQHVNFVNQGDSDNLMQNPEPGQSAGLSSSNGSGELDIVPKPDFLADFLRSFAVFDDLRRKIIITEKGYIGLGHALCKAGDLVCLLEGCSAPVILRECYGRYEVVGEAFVYSIMHSEGWNGPFKTFFIQ